jgi:uncharacterized repeat protein (TIGR02543 family)
MRYAVRLGCIALLSVFFISIINSCSSNSSESYSIEGSVTPSEAGNVTPATGEYDEGTEVEIRAEANSTWMFSSWEGDLSGTENPVVVEVDDDMVFTALFEKLQHPLEVNIDGGGTVEENIIQSKMTDYEVGTEVELNAIADDGWVFVEWQGDLSGSENPQTLTMDEEKSVTAVFERKDYPLTISTQGQGNVSEEVVEDPAKDYAYETVVELTANPSEGWQFARWEGDLEGTENPKEITIDSEEEVTAVFEREGYELSVNVIGEGSVNEELLDDASKTSYPFDSVVELTAEPADGWTFVGWEGDLSGDENPTEITMDDDKEVTAVFERRDYALNINTDGEGSVNEEVVSEPNKDYTFETVVELTASPADGWNFVRWEGDLEGSDNPQEISIDEEKTVTAVFERESFELTVDVTGQGNVNEEQVGQAKTAYGYNSIVELTAEPDEGWEFDEWQGDLSGDDNPKEITIDGNKNVTAVFVEAQYELNLSSEGDGEGNISVDPDKDFYDHGEEIELTANPNEVSEFKEWSGDISGSENPKTLTVTSDLDIIAIFGGRPEVETADWSDMRVNSVMGGGEVTNDGGFEVTDRGVCWSRDENPNLSDSCTNDGSGTGLFESDITGLSQDYTYYVRAYATNQAGTSYGDQIELKAGYVSHGYINGLTPSADSEFEDRSYKLVESDWKGGEDKIWIELNLGATGYVKDVTDDTGRRAGWYFQFNREQGYFHDGSSRTPGDPFETVDEASDWEIENDPCRIAFGGNWRIPTQNEWAAFRIASSSDGGMDSGNRDDAFSSLLRMHAAGLLNVSGDVNTRGSIGYYWSREQTSNEDGGGIYFSSSGSDVIDNMSKSAAFTVRCVKD